MSSGQSGNSGNYSEGDWTFDASQSCEDNQCKITIDIGLKAAPIVVALKNLAGNLTTVATGAGGTLDQVADTALADFLSSIVAAGGTISGAGQNLVNQLGDQTEGPSGTILGNQPLPSDSVSNPTGGTPIDTTTQPPTQTTPGGVTLFLQPDGTYSTQPYITSDGGVYTGTAPLPSTPVEIPGGGSYVSNPDGTITVSLPGQSPFTTAPPDVTTIQVPGQTQSPLPYTPLPQYPQQPIPQYPTEPIPQPCYTPQQPCKPVPPPTASWIGYCNPQTGAFIVRSGMAASPGAPWVIVSISDDQQTAAQEAASACQSSNGGQPNPSAPSFKPPVYPPSWQSNNCDLSLFRDPEKLDNFFGNAINSQLFNFIYQTVGNTVDAALGAISDVDITGAIKAATKILTNNNLTQAIVAIPGVCSLLGCTNTQFITGMEQLAALKYWEKQAGVPVGEFSLPYHYALRALCPTKQLTPDQGLAAYLSNQLSLEDLGTLWTIDGHCPQNLQPMLQAARAKPIPAQLFVLRNRKIITPHDYAAYMRQLGYIDDGYSDLVYKSTLPLPQLGEAIYIAARGADNQAAVQKYGLDDHFADLVGGDTQSWMESHGYQPDHIRDAWRSHWKIPGIGQLFEMWWRLRSPSSPNDPSITMDDITQALTLNGVPDFWAKKFEGIIYRPMPIFMAKSAYNQGGVPDDIMRKVMVWNGMSDSDADRVMFGLKQTKIDTLSASAPVKQWLAWIIDGPTCQDKLTTLNVSVADAQEVMRRAEGGFERSPACRAFTDGVMDGGQLRALLRNQGVTGDGTNAIITVLGYSVRTTVAIERYKLGLLSRADAEQACNSYEMAQVRYNSVLDALDAERQLTLSAKCVNGIRRQYILGAINAGQAQAALVQIGIVLERTNEIFAGWNCEMQTRSKQVSVNTLCNWLATGKISQADMYTRLQNLGYTSEDAINILGDCIAANNLKQQKIAERQAAQLAAAAAKQAVQNARNAKAAQTKLASLEKARQATLKARINIQKMLVTAAGYLSKAGTGTVAATTNAVVQAFADIQSKYGLSQINAIAIVVPIAEKYSGPSLQDFEWQVDQAAQTAVEATANLAGQEISETSMTGAPTQPQASDLGPPLLPS